MTSPPYSSTPPHTTPTSLKHQAEKEARKKAGASTISAEALRKARRLGQLSDKAAASTGAGAGGGGKEGLFKYVQRAGAAVGPATAKAAAAASSSAGGADKGGKGKGKGGDAGAGQFEQELESQLSALLANPTAASSATRRPLATPLTAGGSGVRPLSRCVDLVGLVGFRWR